jgi:hypothetical protein
MLLSIPYHKPIYAMLSKPKVSSEIIMSKVQKIDASKILSNVPSNNFFQFYTSEGVYAHIEAKSLEDFADKLDGIDASSILFHYPRGDFQAWIKNSVGDSELADKMCFIPKGISEESLRQELLKMVQKRVSELKAIK